MTMKIDIPTSDGTQLSFDDLKRKQSVRATFKLPQEIIELLSVIAGQLGIKQKSLLDQLIEDTCLLGSLPQEANQTPKSSTIRRQKTYVISRSSLRSINDIAKKKNISRDILVEFSIRRLLPVIQTELEKHNKRKVILADMKKHMQNSERLCQQAKQTLGKEDALFNMLQKQLLLAQKNLMEAHSVLEKGMPMEDW